ncbi:MAG: hypothetical protein ABI686_14950 [Acidobacteriota bacterium]
MKPPLFCVEVYFVSASNCPLSRFNQSKDAALVSASLATKFALFCGRDDVQFQINFGGTPNVIRNYRSFSALTNGIARSRVFGGVHFPTDTAAGQSAGRSVAIYVFLNYLTPRRCNL